jgi:DNA-binding LacI/PurR family transcriptional regulator
LKAAKELSYMPDLLARGLVQKQTPIVGVVVLELANPFFTPIIEAIQVVARQKDYLMIVSQSERQPALEQSSLTRFHQIRVAGVLMTPASTQLEHLRRLKATNTPLVLVARHWDDCDYVAIDDRHGGQMVGEHLVRLGHHHVACVTVDEPHNSAVQARIQGFQIGLQAREDGGAQLQMILTKTQRLRDGMQAADTFLELPNRPSATFVTADRMAIGFIHRLRERGVQVPRDVAVVGYDDIRYSEFMEVPLTTVALPKYEMGQQAAQILFERIETDPVGARRRQVLLQPKLIVRESCGAHASGI